jgi:hypothetical protein
MKFLRLAYWLFLCIVVMTAQTITSNAQNTNRAEKNLNISIDFQSARAVADLLSRKRVADADLNRVAALFGNQQLIRKAARNNPTVTAETFKQTLRGAIENQSFAEDPFEWQTVKRNLPEIRLLVARIEKEQNALFANLENLLQPYVPVDLKVDATAVLLVGGGSLGFTLSDDQNFYVALHKIGGDYEGLKYIVAHELYHSIQTLGREKRIASLKAVKPPDNVRNSLIIIESAYVEGTATLVGSSLGAKNLKQFGQSRQDEYKKNLARSRQNFALFEALLFQAYHDPNANLQQLYNIGFTTAFDETLYYVGYQMARDIEKYQGKQAIAALVGKNPLELFNLYVELYKKNNDPALLKFSPTTEDILSKLQQWKGQNALIYEGW